jgi:tRNA threonylcarbamoyladenosine biosynthesis protein TsaB
VKLLAIDTATEQCSVALSIDGNVLERCVITPRGHADLVLPMVDELLREGGVRLADLGAIAYGRGPGAFTGLRIAISVVQGLAFGAEIPTIGISDLAAVAYQAAMGRGRVMAAMDARMGEVYWGIYECDPDAKTATAVGTERLSSPEEVRSSITHAVTAVAGTAATAYPQIAEGLSGVEVRAGILPHARTIVALAEAEYLAGRLGSAADAQPVYIRDRVATVKVV